MNEIPDLVLQAIVKPNKVHTEHTKMVVEYILTGNGTLLETLISLYPGDITEFDEEYNPKGGDYENMLGSTLKDFRSIYKTHGNFDEYIAGNKEFGERFHKFTKVRTESILDDGEMLEN